MAVRPPSLLVKSRETTGDTTLILLTRVRMLTPAQADEVTVACLEALEAALRRCLPDLTVQEQLYHSTALLGVWAREAQACMREWEVCDG